MDVSQGQLDYNFLPNKDNSKWPVHKSESPFTFGGTIMSHDELTQVWPLTHFIMFAFGLKKSLICLEAKSMSPY